MDAVKFVEERRRMFAVTGENPKYSLFNMTTRAEDVVKEVEEWSAAHPLKTRQSVFLEQWPNVAVSEGGVIKIRPCNLDVNAKKECLGVTCDYCRRAFWMQEVE